MKKQKEKLLEKILKSIIDVIHAFVFKIIVLDYRISKLEKEVEKLKNGKRKKR
jgi:hypothetical protein